MITVNSVFLNMCLKLCLLTVSRHTSSSLILYLLAAGGNFFELYSTNFNAPLFHDTELLHWCLNLG